MKKPGIVEYLLLDFLVLVQFLDLIPASPYLNTCNIIIVDRDDRRFKSKDVQPLEYKEY